MSFAAEDMVEGKSQHVHFDVERLTKLFNLIKNLYRQVIRLCLNYIKDTGFLLPQE